VSLAETARERFVGWLNATPDDTVLNWLFGSMLLATVTVLGLDYWQMAQAAEQQASVEPSQVETPGNPAKPSSIPLAPARRDGDKRVGPLRAPDKQLGQTMTFELMGDGRLLATGTITPGVADAFAAEVEKRGSYVKTVVLHSPGGSVQDALRMGRLIREKAFATEVENGKYCASSCPLIFAGGVERRAGEKAAIGVHQVFAAPGSVVPASNASGMDQAQRISAQCQKYLRDMGVDLGVWVHAMETPKDELFYFKPDELLTLKLATQSGKSSAPAKKA
jgi:hypothetical protein